MNHSAKNPSSKLEAPLRIFSHAKQDLIEIFEKLNSISDELQKFMSGSEMEANDLFGHQRQNLSYTIPITEHKAKIMAILKILMRNNMKVCFFGRTSNGKSTVINCMLRDRILPAGMGHTTNCFLQIEGSDEPEPYCVLPRSEKKFSIEVLSKLDQSEFQVGISELVRIIWPKAGCGFLNEDIVLIDSPGIDVSADLDSWIEEYCMDADVFVLVCNAEAVLSRTERHFFVSVSKKLSLPNIFILNNRWDMTSTEPKRDELRQQHRGLEVDFLCEKLRVCGDKVEALNRIFFVSAKEALSKRISELHPNSDETLIELPGHQERSEEFDSFEREFTHCLSQSALRTKFKPHAEQGQRMVDQYNVAIDRLSAHLAVRENAMQKEHERAVERAEAMERELHDLTAFVKDRIRHVTTIVQEKVLAALREEIVRLSDLVDKFNIPFNSDIEHITYYKTELNKYMEERLGENLSDRLGRVLSATTEAVQREVREKVMGLLDGDSDSIAAVKAIVNRTDFSAAYRLYFSNLCADFNEDISFKFSLSPSLILSRLSTTFRSCGGVGSGGGGGGVGVGSHSDSRSSVEHAKDTIRRYSLSSQQSKPAGFSATTNTLVAMQALAFLSTPSSAATFAIVGGSAVAFRGWKLLIGATALLGGIYVLERALWTKKAKLRTFKRQYVDFASAKLRMVSDKTSGNASSQVQQELSIYFAQVCKHADESKDNMLDFIKSSDQQLHRFTLVHKKLNTLRKTAFEICSALANFSSQFLVEANTAFV